MMVRAQASLLVSGWLQKPIYSRLFFLHLIIRFAIQ